MYSGRSDEVQRDVHADLFGRNDSLQVHVEHFAPGRMTLDVLEDSLLVLVANLDVQDARVEGLALELLQDLVMVKHQGARLTAAAIQDCGNLSLFTQAAARTFPLVFTEFRNQIEFITHRSTPYLIDLLRLFSRRFRDQSRRGRAS
jgi:hypothetical protein